MAPMYTYLREAKGAQRLYDDRGVADSIKSFFYVKAQDFQWFVVVVGIDGSWIPFGWYPYKTSNDKTSNDKSLKHKTWNHKTKKVTKGRK